MTLQQLIYLSQVFACQSYSKAASILGVSQPTVSLAIKGLEDELGMELLHKSNNKIELTPAGDLVLRCSRNVTNEISSLKNSISLLAKTKNTYTLFSSALVIQRTLIPYMQQVQAPFLLDYEIATKDNCVEALLNGDCDFITTIGPVEDANVESMYLQHDPVYVCVPFKNPLSAANKLTLSDLKNNRIIYYESKISKTLSESVIQYARQNNIELNAFSEKDYIIYRETRNENSVIFISSELTRRYDGDIPNHRFIPLELPGFKLEYYASFLKKNKENLIPILIVLNNCYRKNS